MRDLKEVSEKSKKHYDLITVKFKGLEDAYIDGLGLLLIEERKVIE